MLKNNYNISENYKVNLYKQEQQWIKYNSNISILFLQNEKKKCIYTSKKHYGQIKKSRIKLIIKNENQLNNKLK